MPIDETITIFVKQMDKPIMLSVSLTDTVAETMKEFMDVQGFTPEANFIFRWVFAGKRLNKQVFRIPGGTIGIALITLLGLLGCTITLVIGFIAPAQLNMGHHYQYQLILLGGIVLGLAPSLVLYAYRKKSLYHPAPPLYDSITPKHFAESAESA